MDETEKVRQTSTLFSYNVTTAVIFVTTFLLIYYNTRRKSGVPPGPPLLPIVGNLFSLLGNDVLKALRDFRQKFGDIFALYIGTELFVFLNGHDILHEALIKKGSLFLRRPYSSYYRLVVRHTGIVYLNDAAWKRQRSLVLKALNTLFFQNGAHNFTSIVHHETEKLINTLHSFANTGASFELEDTLLISVANITCDLLFKRNFGHDDAVFLEDIKSISNVAREVGKMQVLCNCFPFLAKFPGDLLKADYVNALYKKVIDDLKPYIEECKNDPNTFVGLYWEEMEKEARETGQRSEDERYIETTSYDLLAAGSETTSTTLLWLLLYLMNNPSIQDTMYSEIASVKGSDIIISPELTKQLPYSNAVIYEGLRLSAAVPLGIPHTVPRDITFQGYLIPENCTIITNLNSALMDPSVWEDPDVFRPERFLNQSKTEVVVPKAFVPFAIGQRSCAGESLARMELFVFLTSMVANFRFVPIDEDTPYDMEGVLSITWHPKPFQMKVMRRLTVSGNVKNTKMKKKKKSPRQI